MLIRRKRGKIVFEAPEFGEKIFDGAPKKRLVGAVSVHEADCYYFTYARDDYVEKPLVRYYGEESDFRKLCLELGLPVKLV